MANDIMRDELMKLVKKQEQELQDLSRRIDQLTLMFEKVIKKPSNFEPSSHESRSRTKSS
jgi:hypothetical protein